jgi:hypothetical protein
LNVFHKVLSRATPAALALALAAAASVRADMPTGQPIDGITCDRAEGAVFHIHQHLSILDRGKTVEIPSVVGRPIAGTCLYWVHTHGSDGTIHVESPKFRTFTLGNFFDIWGEPLSKKAVGPIQLGSKSLRAYVDGQRYFGDPRKIELAQHSDITLEVGPPFSKPAAFTDWGGN